MKLSLADKLSLIYTSAGSMRNVAALSGLSHQKVGRILRGDYVANSRALKDPGLIYAVNTALNIHTEIAKSQARQDGLPFSSEVPIYYRRAPLMDGRPGDRVAAMHTHWLTDNLRGKWIGFVQRSGKFYAASVQSIVNLKIYNNRADKANQNRVRSPLQKVYRKEFREAIKNGLQSGPVNTAYTPLDRSFPLSDVLADIARKLREKHEPAADDKSLIANQILLQVDTRNATAAKKARGNKGRARKPRN